ncbi:MAG: alcohol dehydrogenase catalytic domain-containing protein [Blautia sp.]
MKTLVVNKDGSLEVKEIPKPSYNSKQALVKTISCGICNGTDAKLIHRTFKGVEMDQYPLMLGHEAVGEVVEVGADVKTYHIGDKVLLPFVDPDPEKYGELGSAWGGYSEYAVVNDAAAFEAKQHRNVLMHRQYSRILWIR